MKLEEARKKIDAIDRKIIKLLAERLEICTELGEYKQKNNLPIKDRKRELEIIQDRLELLKQHGFGDERFVKDLFEIILKKSREVQK